MQQAPVFQVSSPLSLCSSSVSLFLLDPKKEIPDNGGSTHPCTDHCCIDFLADLALIQGERRESTDHFLAPKRIGRNQAHPTATKVGITARIFLAAIAPPIHGWVLRIKSGRCFPFTQKNLATHPPVSQPEKGLVPFFCVLPAAQSESVIVRCSRVWFPACGFGSYLLYLFPNSPSLSLLPTSHFTASSINRF